MTKDNRTGFAKSARTPLEQLLIGQSPAMVELRNEVALVANTTASILICGPSGSGKEVVARALHQSSDRRDGPFVPVNCGAIPAELLESELFGHEKGAFTGAIAQFRGKFEQANGGTLFLDEIGDMPMAMQVKLLRVLEDGKVQRVGGKGQTTVDVRIVAATHRDLGKAIDEGHFREDLFYRIAVYPIFVPALADRTSDIPALIRHFQRNAGFSPIARFADDAFVLAGQYDWPGNVRELRNVVQRGMLIHAGQTIDARAMEHLLRSAQRPQRTALPALPTLAIHNPSPRVVPAAQMVPVTAAPAELDGCEGVMIPREDILPMQLPDSNEPVDLQEMLASFERQCIIRALDRANGNVSEAARLLSLQRTTLISKLQKYELARIAA